MVMFDVVLFKSWALSFAAKIGEMYYMSPYVRHMGKKHPAYSDHPTLLANKDFTKKLVPLALHGDGTPVIGIGKIWSRQQPLGAGIRYWD